MRDSAFFQKTSPINLLRIEIAVTKYKYLSQLALPIRKMFSSTEIFHGPASRICNFEFIDLGVENLSLTVYSGIIKGTCFAR